MERKSHSEHERRVGVRVSDPVGGPPDLHGFFQAYEEHFRDSEEYTFHCERLIAEYSAGAGAPQLREAFSFVVEKLVAHQRRTTERFGAGQLALMHKGKYAETFRTALVLASCGLCLRVPHQQFSTLLACCERGDSLLETIATAADPSIAPAPSTALFYRSYDRLYDCLTAAPEQRSAYVHDYLRDWYDQKMEGFAFKDVHREAEPLHYVGYWCFEAAGIVAALNIEDSSFASQPHYPRDLVAMYRELKP